MHRGSLSLVCIGALKEHDPNARLGPVFPYKKQNTWAIKQGAKQVFSVTWRHLSHVCFAFHWIVVIADACLVDEASSA